jgi:hypothetical protein
MRKRRPEMHPMEGSSPSPLGWVADFAVVSKSTRPHQEGEEKTSQSASAKIRKLNSVQK